MANREQLVVSEIQRLHVFLRNVTVINSTMSKSDEDVAIKLLTGCWSLLRGSGDQKTFSNKIPRIENLQWNDPVLAFKLERHGRTINNSSRHDLHFWEVNLNHSSAKIVRHGHRQDKKMSPRFDAKACAQKIATLIINKTTDKKLNWNTNKDYVVLNISEIVPGSVPQTNQERRKRFKKELKSIMLDTEWERRDKGNKVGFYR